MYTIKNRNGEQVNEITLKPAEWCRFIGSKGGEYIITNAYGRMSVSKSGTIDELKATKEIRNAPIYIAAPGEDPAPAQEETAVESQPKEIKLQGVHGKQEAKAVKELNKGDVIMWNFGYTSEVVDVIFSETGKTATVMLKSNTDGIIRDRKMGANTLVAIVHIDDSAPAKEEPTVETAPRKTKKLTEKEWKKQLAAKAAFEAAEKEAKCAEIERRFNALQIGDKLSDGSTITKIDVEIYDEPDGSESTWRTVKTDFDSFLGFGSGYYDVDDFLNGVISFEETPKPEQPNENQITFDEITAYSANDTAENAPAPSPIDETAAKRGHESYSTSDYKPGSATAEYNAAVASVKAAAGEVRERIPEEYRGELDKLVTRYAAKLADWTNRKNRADASCPSWFITGAANYPHRKHEKQMQRLDKLFKEYDQITALEERIKNFAYECKHRPIKAGDASAPEKLRAKVEELTALQDQMKRENTAARRRGEPAPYGAYSLGNNRQNLKRYADRLAALERAKTAPQTDSPEIKGESFRVVRNTDIMRLQIIFDGKPDEQTRTLLKSNGFKWAPSQMAWQRQLTANAERAARTVAASL